MLTPLTPVVRDVVERERRRFDGSVMRLRAGGGEPRVALREPDCRSVSTNLVTNALEVTGGHGPVEVGVRLRDGHVALRVADRGPGLPSGDVFAAFFSTKPAAPAWASGWCGPWCRPPAATSAPPTGVAAARNSP